MSLTTLEGRSHCPHRHRPCSWSARCLAERVLALRQRCPRWGKDKLAVLLRQQQISISTSMVGRILRQLKEQGRLTEAPRSGVAGSRRALRSRPYAIRKPKQYTVSRPPRGNPAWAWIGRTSLSWQSKGRGWPALAKVSVRHAGPSTA